MPRRTKKRRHHRSLDELELATATWNFRFHCWRRALTHTVATAACACFVWSIIDGRVSFETLLVLLTRPA